MKKIISGIIFIILIAGFIIIGLQNYDVDKPKDNETFSAEYEEIDENNIYIYADASKVLQKLRSGSGIIFFGFKSNVWAGYYANILNEAAMNLGVQEIYYYDFYEDRKNHNGTYESIVELIKDYVTVLDDGTKNLYSPSMVIVKDGKILIYNDDTAFIKGDIKPEDYWTDAQKNAEINKLSILINGFLNEMESEISEWYSR